VRGDLLQLVESAVSATDLVYVADLSAARRCRRRDRRGRAHPRQDRKPSLRDDVDPAGTPLVPLSQQAKFASNQFATAWELLLRLTRLRSRAI